MNSRPTKHANHTKGTEASNLIYPAESYAIVGACFLEAVYQECLEIELEYQRIPFQPQCEIELTYRDRKLRHKFKPDLLCYGKIVVELKAVSKLADDHRAQVLNYLNATKFQLGLLINFGHYPKAQSERFILTEDGVKIEPTGTPTV